jgi:hypothetical protein
VKKKPDKPPEQIEALVRRMIRLQVLGALPVPTMIEDKNELVYQWVDLKMKKEYEECQGTLLALQSSKKGG